MMFLSDLKDGSSVFIDANIFVYHFSKESKFNSASSIFLERAEKKEIYGFTSIPIIQEVSHRLMILEAVAVLPEVKRKDLVKYLKEHPDIVKKLVTHQGVPGRISSFNLEIISSDIQTLIREAIEEFS